MLGRANGHCEDPHTVFTLFDETPEEGITPEFDVTPACFGNLFLQRLLHRLRYPLSISFQLLMSELINIHINFHFLCKLLQNVLVNVRHHGIFYLDLHIVHELFNSLGAIQAFPVFFSGLCIPM